MEELLLVHDGLKEQEFNFREQCKSDLNLLKNKLQEIENGTSEEEEDRLKEYEEQKEAVMKVRLQFKVSYRREYYTMYNIVLFLYALPKL